MLEGELGIAEGSRVISSNYWVIHPEGECRDEFSVFIALDSETDHLPMETERVHWDEAAWQAKQSELRAYEDLYHDDVMAASKNLLSRDETTSGV